MNTARAIALSSALLGSALALGACGSSSTSAGTAPRVDCARCHMYQYLAAKKPVHVGVRPLACEVCHTQQAWSPSVFEHPWPLTGAHARARCASCHVGQPPVYEGTSRLCVDCHKDDRERSDFPGHDRFASTCDDCHSTAAWKPAQRPAEEAGEGEPSARTSAHGAHRESAQAPLAQTAPAETRRHPENRFPIASGAHAGIGCRTCHDQGGAMGRDDTDCVQCHTRSRFDRIHEGVNGYPSGAAPLNFCLHCHAAGRVRGR